MKIAPLEPREKSRLRMVVNVINIISQMVAQCLNDRTLAYESWVRFLDETALMPDQGWMFVTVRNLF